MVFFSSAIWSQNTKTFLPEPTGIYDVGTSRLYLIDSSRKDPFKRRDFRKLFVKIWYPASINENDIPEKYLENYPLEVIYENFKSKNLDKEWIAQSRENLTHSYPEADISFHQEKYPVLLFNPGFYFGLPDFYTSYMEDLASHGYIVCSINHPYEQPYIKFGEEEIYIKRKRAQWAYLQLVIADKFQWKPRNSEEHIEEITHYYHKMLRRFNKIVNLWAIDSKFFIDVIEEANITDSCNIVSRMDIDNIGVFGQSIGGAVSGQLCTIDERVKAGVNLDCFQFGNPIHQPIKQPFMLIQSDYNESWNLGNTINFKKTSGDFAMLSFPGSSHFVFSDAAILPYQTQEIKKNMIGNINGEVILNSTKIYILDFFNYYLKETGPEYIHSDRQLSHLIFSFRKGLQSKKATSSASKN